MSAITDNQTMRMTKLMDGCVIARLLFLVADLGIADHLASGPATVDTLAERTGTHAATLHRVLRTLAGEDVFTETTPGTFALTPLADTLRTDTADSIRDLARIRGRPEHWAALAGLEHSVQTGRAGFEHAYGMDWWSYLETHPDQGALFTQAMGNDTQQVHAAAAQAYDFSETGHVVDVGGGRGDLAVALLHRYPDLTAAVHDRAQVIRDADALVDAEGLRDRVQLTTGDFFESVPPGGDIYLLCRVLHDWGDTEVIGILTTIARTMPATSKLVVLDAVIPEDSSPHPAKAMDMVMLAMHGGRERTESEFAALFEAAGLRHTETRPTASAISVLVAAPA